MPVENHGSITTAYLMFNQTLRMPRNNGQVERNSFFPLTKRWFTASNTMNIISHQKRLPHSTVHKETKIPEAPPLVAISHSTAKAFKDLPQESHWDPK